jgi:hypothetical protein
MHATFVDIENEFGELEEEVVRLARFLQRIGQADPSPDMQSSWEAVHVCASATEKIYTGCERIMARLASEVDRAPLAHADGWHTALLRRMAHPFPDVRKAVISDDCYRRLDRLRAFRHRERNAYGTHLDFDIVVERSLEAVTAFDIFRRDVRLFFAVRQTDDRNDQAPASEPEGGAPSG